MAKTFRHSENVGCHADIVRKFIKIICIYVIQRYYPLGSMMAQKFVFSTTSSFESIIFSKPWTTFWSQWLPRAVFSSERKWQIGIGNTMQILKLKVNNRHPLMILRSLLIFLNSVEVCIILLLYVAIFWALNYMYV